MLRIEASYFLFASVAIAGVLQAVAAYYRLVGLSLIRDIERPLLGYLLGAALITGAFLWLFSTQDGIFIPGPAGAQFMLLFSIASICALGITLLLSTAIHRASSQHRRKGHSFDRQQVSFEWGQGMLYVPQSQSPPWPAICIVSNPEGGCDALGGLTSQMASNGFAALVVDLNTNRYPEVLTLLPMAISYLSNRGDVDQGCIGAMGIDLGGDLAICAAVSDERLKAVVALAPLFEEESAQPGLGLLREMTYLEAIRWSRFLDGGKLLAKLATVNCVKKLDARPLLIIYGKEDGLVSVEKVRRALGEKGELKLVQGERHMTLSNSPMVASMAAHWFKGKV